MATCFCTRTDSCQWSADLDCSEAQISVNYRQISAAHSQRNVACIRANVVANSQYSLALSSGPAFKHSSRGYVGFGDIVWISSYCSARHARSVSSEINCQTARMSCAVAVKLQNARKLLVHSARRPPSCNLDPMKFFKLYTVISNGSELTSACDILTAGLSSSLCRPKQLTTQRIAGFSSHDSTDFSFMRTPINSSNPPTNDIFCNLSSVTILAPCQL